MPGRLLKIALVALAVGAPLCVGCGGDDGEDAPAAVGAGEKSASERHAARATAICRRERRAIAEQLADFRSEREAGPSQNAELAEEALEEVILPGFRRQYEGLRRLWPPRGDEDFFDLMLSKFSRSLENGEEDLDRLFRVKPSGYSEFGEGTLMTEEYGIEGCGSPGHSPQAVYRGFDSGSAAG